MKIGVLGPLVATVNGKSVVPTAVKPRQVFALLALNANHVVTVSQLMNEIWVDDPPPSAATTLQTYILQLRRRLAAALGDNGNRAAKEVLTTSYGGYRLAVAPVAVDVVEFNQLNAQARIAEANGDSCRTAQLYRRALALWRERALVDVRIGPVLEPEKLMLDEARLGALEGRIAAELRLGMHLELLSELTELSARNPLHEGFNAKFMIALYRSGRRSQALEAYNRLRRNMSEELGLEPTIRMRHLQQAMLSADPALEASPAAADLAREWALTPGAGAVG